jgi:bifunctional oligoribonuclease and PAP phosphatase NrnA
MDFDIATCLFTGIMTDTGCFSFNSSYPEVYISVAELLSFGIDKDYIYSKIYDNFSESRMRLMGYCLYEKMVLLPGARVAYICLSEDEMKRFSHSPGDTEGFVNLPFSIKGVIFAALFIEKKDHVKISFRSRGNFPANEFSNKHFSGGGHLNAAGGESKEPIDKVIEKFTSSLLLYKELYHGV